MRRSNTASLPDEQGWMEPRGSFTPHLLLRALRASLYPRRPECRLRGVLLAIWCRTVTKSKSFSTKLFGCAEMRKVGGTWPQTNTPRRG